MAIRMYLQKAFCEPHYLHKQTNKWKKNERASEYSSVYVVFVLEINFHDISARTSPIFPETTHGTKKIHSFSDAHEFHGKRTHARTRWRENSK